MAELRDDARQRDEDNARDREHQILHPMHPAPLFEFADVPPHALVQTSAAHFIFAGPDADGVVGFVDEEGTEHADEGDGAELAGKIEGGEEEGRSQFAGGEKLVYGAGEEQHEQVDGEEVGFKQAVGEHEEGEERGAGWRLAVGGGFIGGEGVGGGGRAGEAGDE